MEQFEVILLPCEPHLCHILSDRLRYNMIIMTCSLPEQMEQGCKSFDFIASYSNRQRLEGRCTIPRTLGMTDEPS